MAEARDRLRTVILLTSPDGAQFQALWRGNDYSQSKKVGVFNFPRVDGSIVQDLGVSSTLYTLTIFFEGKDHDLTARAFMSGLRERGVWDVIHPVHGLLHLQPLSFSPADQPVTSDNMTQIETEWIEPLSLDVLPTASELQAEIAALNDELNEVAADQLSLTTFQKIAADVAEFRSSVLDGVAAVEGTIQGIADVAADITAEIESIKRDINAVLAVVPLDVIALAGQLQELIQLPARAIQDVETRLDTYLNFADAISLTLTPEIPGTPSFNRVAVQDLCFTAVIGAVADISSTGVLASRAQSVGVIETNIALLKDATDVLDASQALFDDQSIDTQYFSQSQTYALAAKLTGLTVAYLLRAAFDLKVEKRFILERSRNPVMVTIEEYGSLGDGDANLDLFLDSNKIEDSEHLLMSKGRELVVYV
jgi:prophage DNA circulation protein